MEAVIEIDELQAAYGEVVALTGVSMSIDAGEIFGLIGPNGAGKSTLIRSITGTKVPQDGVVRVFGSPPDTVDPDRFGLLPQDFSPAGRLTGRELIGYYAGLYDDPRSVDAVLADVGMTEASDQWFERLSGGQKRRICMGTALVNDPDILVLDEPTTGIDPAGRRRVWSLLEEIRADGRTVLLATHDMEEAAELCDRVALLDDGEVLDQGRPVDLVSRYGGDGRIVIDPMGSVDLSEECEFGWPIEQRDGQLVVTGVTPEDVGEVIASIEHTSIAYGRITWELPTLETVFLAQSTEREYR